MLQAWGEWFDRLTTSRTREGVILPTLETKKDPMRDHFSFAGIGKRPSNDLASN